MASYADRKEPRSAREIKLSSQFQLFLKGQRKVVSVLDGQHFLEAACLQGSAGACVERIISEKDGLVAVHNAFRRDLSKDYIQKYAVGFMLYISDPEVKALNSGVFLHKILRKIVEPLSFWNALLELFQKKELDERAVEAVAWLTVELLSSPTPIAEEVLDTIQSVVNDGSLLESKSQLVRSHGYRLQKLVRLLGNTSHARTASGPGGRHDNDFESIRQIAIYPTRDELLCKEVPHLRLASEIAEVPSEDRVKEHLDNQFRLLREDMLGEIRSDIQIALKVKKSGRRTATVLSGLSLFDINFRTRFNSDGRVSVLVRCKKGLEKFSALPEKRRKDFLNANPGFLKHQSFGAFCCNEELLAFGFVWKEEEMLLRTWPVIEIQVPDGDALRKVLGALLQHKPLDFALVDTAIFAYEPVLRRLKSIMELPLDTCLLNPAGADELEFQPKPGIQRAVDDLKSYIGNPGTTCTIHKKPVDDDQIQSIINALSRPVSTILGPPGRLSP